MKAAPCNKVTGFWRRPLHRPRAFADRGAGTGRWRDPDSVRRYEHVIASEESQQAAQLPVEKTWKMPKSGVKTLKRKGY